MRKMLLSLLACALLSGPTFADDDHKILESSCKISRKQAQDIAVARISGDITDTDLETKNGKPYWSIDIKPSKDVEREVHIDALTGDILSVENDDD
ncbi:MAG: PepSY domain-containing protein [Candidatus Obscuribacterales bacterium]|nr:PepSY domain-containing protein [Candidatus Obscuribacterales bacterium]